jgi:chemotaxis protein MotB
MSLEEPVQPEILIIRRGRGDELAAHKGGAWKIAYADFVTAMMAFFLVMWLINSANEATRARVASYFNPIKMTDAAPSGKGLKDIANTKRSESKVSVEGSSEKAGDLSENKGGGKTDTEKSVTHGTEDQMLNEPFKAIDAISKEGFSNPSGRTVEVVSQKTGDPFDPKAWEVLRAGKQNTHMASMNDKNTALASAAGSSANDKTAPLHEPVTDTEKERVENNITKDHTNGGSQSSLTDIELVARTTSQIQHALRKSASEDAIGFKVQMTSEGLLIVLSDKNGRSMFDVGSAAPNSALIEVVRNIGNVLTQESGRVVVRGHTDARRYRSLRFDNWQLSTARAHMASYILMKGGLSEVRLWKIEGHGSSDLLDRSNPLADENRRVEFLLAK